MAHHEPQNSIPAHRNLFLASVLSLPIFVAVAVPVYQMIAGTAVRAENGATPDNPLRTTSAEATQSPEKGDPSQLSKVAADPKLVPTANDKNNTAPAAQVPPGKHPLDPALEEAKRILDHLNKDVKDYTCVVVKQERIGGTLNPPEFMQGKIRQQPFSVYLKFLKPEADKGREVIYVSGANDGNLVAREGSGLKRAIGFVFLKPNGIVAMQDNRYPITEIGVSNLIDRLIEVGKQDRNFGECEVHFYKNAKVNKRVCTLIEVIHPKPRTNFRFHKARIYIDDELQVPIRYEAYQWPKVEGEEPPLDEAYTYLDMKLNVGLTDADFDYRNPNYRFVDK